MKRTIKHGKSRTQSVTARIIGWYRPTPSRDAKWQMQHKPYDFTRKDKKDEDK